MEANYIQLNLIQVWVVSGTAEETKRECLRGNDKEMKERRRKEEHGFVGCDGYPGRFMGR